MLLANQTVAQVQSITLICDDPPHIKPCSHRILSYEAAPGTWNLAPRTSTPRR